jgi:hypothetical protein
MIRGRFQRLSYVRRISRFAAAILVSLGWPTSGHATLYVIVLDRQGITIASDSRRITVTAQEIRSSDGLEKVIPLGPKLAFMSSGLTEISIGTTVVRPSQLVRKSYAELLRRYQNVSVKDLAISFGRLTAKRLHEMSCPQKARVSLLLQTLGAPDNQVMEAIIAGLEGAANFKVETIDFYLSRMALSSVEVLQFDWTIHESVPDDNPRVILSGEISVLKSAFQDGASPIGHLPSFTAWWQALQQGKHLDATATAEALLNLAIQYSSPNQTRLGYPIFVYTLNAQDGLRRLRIVPEGRSVDLPH